MVAAGRVPEIEVDGNVKGVTGDDGAAVENSTRAQTVGDSVIKRSARIRGAYDRLTGELFERGFFV